ncbi:MAG: hypothetical protein JW982_07025 [Spirochaetes bacterium]|nr:hypothetical protein [Spirochaetota bacterium]
MEKDFLQSLKLEISKHATLNTYERIAFFKILSILKSESGMKILLNDCMKEGFIRLNALNAVKDFNYPEVTTALLQLLENPSLQTEEIFIILEHFEKYGNSGIGSKLKNFIENRIADTESITVLEKAIYVLGITSSTDSSIESYLKNTALNTENFEKIRCASVEALTFTSDMNFFESLIAENNNSISYSVYRTLSIIADKEMKKYEEKISDETFTVLPGEEDRILLDIRVMLGKMSIQYDSYSNEAKTAFILAMLSCGHREFIIYTMKALTSDNTELIDMTLYLLLSNIKKIRNPDKLFRSLIALPSVTSNDDRLIVEIFHRYFDNFRETRSSVMMRDKIYNYCIVMMDTYFESYRKNFMIPEIMEQDYPENFRKIRKFILNKFSPELKRKIVTNLQNNELDLKNLIFEISEKIFYTDEDHDQLQCLIEILYESDPKAREIAVTRLIDIDFEKRYMRSRILRLCSIIAKLKIDEASTNLVKIFNYVKKYRDEDIFNAVTYTLSVLNYPYMLSELEILLISGDITEQSWAVNLLALFVEHRSINIMLDYLNANGLTDNPVIEKLINILISRDIKHNKGANQIAKKIIENSKRDEIKKSAAQMVGKTAYEEDIKYLNDIFTNTENNFLKEGIVQAFDFIVQGNPELNTRSVIEILKGYLRDPGIKVRMYSCSILLQLGNKDALTTLQDMMVIKNRKIQRDILTLLGGFINIEIAFFLLFLLKEDYAISSDIIPLLYNLDAIDMKEIDHFSINLFKKFEGYDYDYSFGKSKEITEANKHKLEETFSEKSVNVLIIEISNYSKILSIYKSTDLSITYKKIYDTVAEIITENSGTISCLTGGRIISYYSNYPNSANAMLEISKKIKLFNSNADVDKKFEIFYYLKNTKTYVVNQEIIYISSIEHERSKSANLPGILITNSGTASTLQKIYKCDSLPDSAFDLRGYYFSFKELKYSMTFINDAESIIAKIKDEEKKRAKMTAELENAVAETAKPLSKDAAAYARAMDDIGRMLKREFTEVNKYVSKRSIDRELISTVEKSLSNIYKLYNLETSKQMLK